MHFTPESEEPFAGTTIGPHKVEFVCNLQTKAKRVRAGESFVQQGAY